MEVQILSDHLYLLTTCLSLLNTWIVYINVQLSFYQFITNIVLIIMVTVAGLKVTIMTKKSKYWTQVLAYDVNGVCPF